jgi:hypothetical protein
MVEKEVKDTIYVHEGIEAHDFFVYRSILAW